MKRCEKPKGEEAPAEDGAQTEWHVRQLEEEIEELQRKTAELEQLSRTDDSLQFLQVSSSWEEEQVLALITDADLPLVLTVVCSHGVIALTGHTWWTATQKIT